MYVPNWKRIGADPAAPHAVPGPRGAILPTRSSQLATRGYRPISGSGIRPPLASFAGACWPARGSTKPEPWGRKLQPGEYDGVQGWGLQLPTDSARDVRARAAYTVNQDKGFPVRTLEIMRDLNTGNGDDLVVNPDGTHFYRMVIGVLNNSFFEGSGSTEIRLQFELRKPRVGTARRC